MLLLNVKKKYFTFAKKKLLFFYYETENHHLVYIFDIICIYIFISIVKECI